MQRLKRNKCEADRGGATTASEVDVHDSSSRPVWCVWRTALGVFCWLFGMVLPVPAQESVGALVRAYPDFLIGQDEKVVIWRDGTRMPVSDGLGAKSFEEKLRRASILDQLSIPYPKGPLEKLPGLEEDPGRFRNTAFFDKMYGDCSKGEAQKKLTTVAWLPKSGGGSVQITTVNAVADRLREISAQLDNLPPDIKKFAFPSAGTFNCRTGQRHPRSQHARTGRGHRRKYKIRRLLAVGPKGGRLPESLAFRHRANLREAWFHLGWQMGTLRHDALRVPAGTPLTHPDLGQNLPPSRPFDDGPYDFKLLARADEVIE
jgi:hypothetical protein